MTKSEKDDIMYKYLGKIDSVKQLKKLNNKQLEVLCSEIRDNLVNTVSQSGGHLASNLGVVELTVALHRVLNTPEDKMCSCIIGLNTSGIKTTLKLSSCLFPENISAC